MSEQIEPAAAAVDGVEDAIESAEVSSEARNAAISRVAVDFTVTKGKQRQRSRVE